MLSLAWESICLPPRKRKIIRRLTKSSCYTIIFTAKILPKQRYKKLFIGIKTALLSAITIKISDIYIPSERRSEINLKEVEDLAEEMISETALKPIKVRKGKDRYVLISGINKLEAHKALGEDTIEAYVVKARQF